MSAVMGVLMLAVSIVLYRWAYIHHRRPIRSRWARNGTASMLVQFTLLAALAGGLSLTLRAVLMYGSEPVTAAEVGAVVVLVAITLLLLRVLKRQWLIFQAEQLPLEAARQASEMPGNDAGPDLPPAADLVRARPRKAS